MNVDDMQMLELQQDVFGDAFICCEDVENVSEVHVYRKHVKTGLNTAKYIRIGDGKFWNGSVLFTETMVTAELRVRHVKFGEQAELFHVVIHDGDDSVCFDAR